MSTAATVFTLFLVTYGADVKESTHPTLNACLEAKSLALTGMTIEAKQAQDDAIAKAQREREAKFDARHPFHEPKTDDERRWVKRGYVDSLETESMCGLEQQGDNLVVQPHCIGEVRDGKIRYVANGGLSGGNTVVGFSPTASEIKTAECVVVPEAKP